MDSNEFIFFLQQGDDPSWEQLSFEKSTTTAVMYQKDSHDSPELIDFEGLRMTFRATFSVPDINLQLTAPCLVPSQNIYVNYQMNITGKAGSNVISQRIIGDDGVRRSSTGCDMSGSQECFWCRILMNPKLVLDYDSMVVLTDISRTFEWGSHDQSLSNLTIDMSNREFTVSIRSDLDPEERYDDITNGDGFANYAEPSTPGVTMLVIGIVFFSLVCCVCSFMFFIYMYFTLQPYFEKSPCCVKMVKCCKSCSDCCGSCAKGTNKTIENLLECLRSIPVIGEYFPEPDKQISETQELDGSESKDFGKKKEEQMDLSNNQEVPMQEPQGVQQSLNVQV